MDSVIEAMKKAEIQLKEKEEELISREKKLDSILKVIHSDIKGPLTIRVCQSIFYTTAEVLKKEKDSYFSVLLSGKFGGPGEDGCYFIPRDEESFRFILEYLTYETLFTIPNRSIYEKLKRDADYFQMTSFSTFLGTLKINDKQDGYPIQKQIIVAKFTSSQATANKKYIVWNSQEIAPPTSHFTHQDDTITILKSGLYNVIVRGTVSVSGNGYYFALYLNGSDVGRGYSSNPNGFYNTIEFQEVLKLNAQDELQVYYTGNTKSYADENATKLTIILLE